MGAKRLAGFRSTGYGLLKGFFGRPAPGAEEKSPAERVREFRQVTAQEAGDTAARLAACLERLEAALTSAAGDETAWDPVSVFGHTASERFPPNEAHYSGAHVFQEMQELADIAGFYRAFGVVVSPAAHERPDHIAAELEFMEWLACKEAWARRVGRDEQAQVCRDAQRAFLAEHLGRWAPVFGELLAARSESEVYRSLGQVLAEFLRFDLTLLEVRPRAVRPVDVRVPAPGFQDECETCGG